MRPPVSATGSVVSVPLLAMVVAAVLAGCGKDPPKKIEDNPTKTTPVPSDMVFNDFVPPSGGGVVGVKHDGGIPEGGMAAAEGTARNAEPGEQPAPEAPKLVVTEPGAEPRAVRKYAFVANRADRRVLTLKQSAVGEGGAAQELMTLALTADFTPKIVKPAATKFEMKVVKLDSPGLPAAQKAQLAAFGGLVGIFDISSHGDVGEIQFKADEKMAMMGGAEVILQSFQQSLDSLLPPFPEAPIGAGAVWERKVERTEPGGPTGKQVFTLKELSGDGGVVTVDMESQAPRKAIPPQRGVPPGATDERKSKGSFTFTFRLDRLPSKVEGETIQTDNVEFTDPRSGQKQAIKQVVKTKSTLGSAEPAAGGKP